MNVRNKNPEFYGSDPVGLGGMRWAMKSWTDIAVKRLATSHVILYL